MSGMNVHTGRIVPDELEHIRQSIRDILVTPIGSRLQRREYGSLLPDLIDHPGTPHNRLRLMSATVMAIVRWEPRVRVESVIVGLNTDGSASIETNAVRRTGPRAGTPISIMVPIK